MKIVTLLSVLFVSCVVFAQTYRSGGAGKAKFGAQQTQQEEGEKSSAPGANSTVKTRTFTSYGARQRAWSQGVQTQGVQTSTAGTAAPKSEEEPVSAAAQKNIKGAVKKGSSNSAADKQAPAGKAAGADPSAEAAQGQPPAMPAEAAAAMQQLQGMQEMMKSLGGGAMPGGAAAGSGAAGSLPAGMPAGMPSIPGMPDMSALMGGAAAGQQPSGKK